MNELIKNLSFADYARRDGLSASLLKHGIKSMLHLKCARELRTAQTSAMRQGTASHLALLEPDKLDDMIIINDDSRNSNKFKELKAMCDKDGITVLKTAEYETALAMAEQAHANSDIARLINGTDHEVSLFWQHDLYGLGKCRPDGYSDNFGIVEYKTTANIDPEAFKRQAWNIGYHIGIGWYCHGVEVVTGVKPAYTFIVQESKPPFDCYTMPVSMPTIDKCIDMALDLARRYKASKVTDTWLGVTNGESVEFGFPPRIESEDTTKVNELEEMEIGEL
jgi:hypothetical protein